MKKICAYLSIFVLVASLSACQQDDDLASLPPSANSANSAKQVDMTVVVPIHPSSLEYFDYVIHYYDNRGVECRDTIQGSYGGIVVDDWNYVDIEITLCATRAALTSNNCYVRTFSYDNMFVTCTVTVEMIPKKDITLMDPFYFYVPKPYIIPSVHNPKTSVIGETTSHIMGGVECIPIDSMTVESFQSTYGRTFSSHCGLYDSYVGYEIFFY